ncbi:hypothetical protein PF010_g12945 [Phytophthora fragariae]|uniref:Uncharacterized protein n=1 Tax=Phytophthora fragariae TaxID=53985 RepID=A0A6G0L175_9STRA|nr:hypothetical protein PF010_g12945 [Phytophthora fragariae]
MRVPHSPLQLSFRILRTQRQARQGLPRACGQRGCSESEVAVEGPVLVRMQVEMQDDYSAAGSVRDERMS